MIMLDETTALVYTHEDLVEAVSVNNGVDYVYLGNNILMPSGIRVHPDKTALVIDGYYQPESADFRTLSDSGADNGQIYVLESQNLELTFQNMTIEGRNFYGMPWVHNYEGSDNVTVTYQSVTYTGPQMIYHLRGLTRFIDCDVMITGSPSSSVHEWGEVCKVEIGGLTTMQKTNIDNAVFWFYGSSTRRPYLKILSGADVTITTAHYFMFETYQPDYIIEPDASFTLNTNSGLSYTSSHTVASFIVGENASFRYTQSANRGFASLYLTGALTVGEGANYYMQTDFESNYPLIQFSGSTTGLYLNNPRSFALYHAGGAQVRALSFPASTPFVFLGNQVNIWDFPTAFPAAGTFDDIPRYKWNRPDWSPFRIEGRAGTSQTSIDLHDFTQEELEQMSPLSDFNLHLATVFSEGNLPLSVNTVVVGTRPITGKTSRRARVRVSRGAVAPYPDCDADDTGFFSVTPADPVPFAEMFTITSNTPFLLTTLTVESREEGLTLLDIPESIRFVTPPMAEFSDVILRRQTPNITVLVSDTRAVKTEWVIWAKITRPLQTEDNNVLADAVVFADEEGALITLGAEFVPVHTDGPYLDIDDVPVMWGETRGVLARITTPIRSGKRYSTQMNWAAYPIGVSPGEED